MENTNRGISIVRLMKQVMDSIKQNVQHEFKEMNLTGPQGMLMGTLAHCGEMKISDLSEKMGLSNSTVSGIIDRLEKQGLVERRRSKEDRRVVLVKVTSEFKKHAEKHFSEIEKIFEAIMDSAEPDEVEKIFEGLDILKRLMEKENNK